MWNQVLWNWSKFMIVYSPFFRQSHVRQLLFNTKFDFIDALIFRFVNFFSIYGKSVTKTYRVTIAWQANVVRTQFVSGWTVGGISFERANSLHKKGLFIRLLFNKRCECDGRSKSRIKMNVNTSVDVQGTLQDRWLSFRILNTPNTGYLDNIAFRMS